MAQVGDVALVVVGVLIAAIGASLITNFRDSANWWYENAGRTLGISREKISGPFSEQSLRRVVGGAFVVVGGIVSLLGAIHI